MQRTSTLMQNVYMCILLMDVRLVCLLSGFRPAACYSRATPAVGIDRTRCWDSLGSHRRRYLGSWSPGVTKRLAFCALMDRTTSLTGATSTTSSTSCAYSAIDGR